MKDVTVGKTVILTPVELSYIAGFLDGDGSVMSLVEKHTEKRYGIRIRVVVEFTQHNDNIAVLKYLQEKIGGGNINCSLRDVWKYSIKNQTLVKELLQALYPFSVLKKQQMKLALKILALSLDNPKRLLRAAKLSDDISKRNLRSKSRKINGLEFVKSSLL